MQFPILNETLASQLAEFDIWITPSLGEITDTTKFKEELSLVSLAFDTIGRATNQFDSIERCQPSAISETLLEILKSKNKDERGNILNSLASRSFCCHWKI
jgi:hypothetical protein